MSVLAAGALTAQSAVIPGAASASAAACTIVGTDGPDVLLGTPAPDVICGGSGDDVLDGLGGDDVLRGENGRDRLLGGDGRDQLEGGNGEDELQGDGDDDTLVGGNGDDQLRGGAGADDLAGERGADVLEGGSGEDRLNGGPAADQCVAESDPSLLSDCETVLPANPDGERDSDGDVLGDDLERRFGSDPAKADTDGDGLTDTQELASLTDPARPDSDADGVLDPDDDTDGDQVGNADELREGTSPTSSDTDGDGLADGAEQQHRTDPRNPDTDGDGLNDGAELELGSDPLRADSDGDGVRDGDDTFDRQVALAGAGVTFRATGAAGAVLAVELAPVQDVALLGTPGLRAPPVEVLAPQALASGTLTLRFNAATLPAGTRLAVLHYDDETGTFDRPATQSVDMANGTATVTTSDFSPFVLVDVDEFEQVWADEITVPREGTDAKPLDAAVVLDSSGSMSWNDPAGARRTAGKAFVDALLTGDRAAVVDFDYWATVIQALTEDLDAVKAAIDTIDSSGGTDIGAGLRAALDELDRLGSPQRGRVVVLLTDGEGSYDPALTSRAAATGTVVYTVGLGSGVQHALLQSIADGTGGKYYQVASADDLVDTFERIGGDLGAPDSDGDGLADAAEIQGLRDGAGRLYRTDPQNPDTDGDGLSDGEEAGQLRGGGAFGAGSYFPMPTDPTRADTDGDGLTDLDEVDTGLRPRSPDSDWDGLTDLTEAELEFDPTSADGDGDGRRDDQELREDTDPFVYDLSGGDKAQALVGGALFGDTGRSWVARNIAGLTEEHITSPWYLGGWLTGGYLAIGDVRDAAYSLLKGNWSDAGLNALGLVPWAGDALKTVRVVGDYVKMAGARAATGALRWLSRNVPGETLRRVFDDLAARFGPSVVRDPIDVARQALNRTPRASTASRIGTDTVQATALRADLASARAQGATDIRVNQEQVNAAGVRVGRNRPDLQYTDAQGRRVYVEYDRPLCADLTTSERGPLHKQRILSNDSAAIVILRVLGERCE